MKPLLKITLFIAFVAVFASCQSSTDVKQIFSNQDTKKAIMDTIANDSNLSIEMMEAMMNNENSKMMMMENEKLTMMMMEDHASMMKMMQNNPEMMQSMITGMMETFKGDSVMMSSMCNTFLENPEMTDMMHKKMVGKMDMKGMKH